MAGEIIQKEDWNNVKELLKKEIVKLPFSQEIFLLECEVAGTGHVENIVDKTEGLQEGSHLTLVREPDNPYDSLAIRIENAIGEKLGYVPKRRNEILARLLDAGKLLYAKVIKREKGYNDWVSISIQVYLKDL